MESLLLYNLYPKNNWKDVTRTILLNVPFHNSIIVNVTLDKFDYYLKRHKYIERYLKKKYKKIDKIVYSLNDKKLGEVVGFNKLREAIDYDRFDIVTYTHSKGVTKPKNNNIQDWVKMMTYFLIERHDLCLRSFDEGYVLYGTQLSKYNYDRVRQRTYKYCDYWYAGTFVSVNIKKIKKEFISTNCPENYYGVEAFFGNLSPVDIAYCAHKSPFPLYKLPYPKENYLIDE